MRLLRGSGFRPARLLVSAAAVVWSVAAQPLPGTAELTGDSDRSEEMRGAIERYLDRTLESAVESRPLRWQRDDTSPDAYVRSVEANRARFARMIGAGVDSRVKSPRFQWVQVGPPPTDSPATGRAQVVTVRWPVYAGVSGEGLLLRPASTPVARIIVIPDADQTPEDLAGLTTRLPPGEQTARRLWERGCEVLVPCVVSRADTHSGSSQLNRFTNQPHREWVYRQAYTFGRHVIGYEVDQVRAAIDCFAAEPGSHPVGVAGWGEGGLLALYTAALDSRVQGTIVSGYFGPREQLWAEPIYRNVHGLLAEFGDAEIASLVTPRALIIDPAPGPNISGPPAGRTGRRASAASGSLRPLEISSVRREYERARQLGGRCASSLHFIERAGPGAAAVTAIDQLLRSLGVEAQKEVRIEVLDASTPDSAAAERQRRRVEELDSHTQGLISQARNERDAGFWKPVPIASPEAWDKAMAPARDRFWSEIIGRLPRSEAALNVRSKLLYDRDDSVGYEVVLDALPGLPLWGYLLIPKTARLLGPDVERRPLVVAQHGLSGLPADMINEDASTRPHRVYKALASQLVREGYIVFVPHFPWRGQDDYRRLQRKANPLGLSIFSFILAHHNRLLDWCSELPFVDPKRIGLYGLSWGGKVALRVPALEPRYALSVCSGDFNEWIWKNATTQWPNSYMFAGEPDMFDFNLGPNFSHAEMAAMIAPRPFMVERGHDDGVGTDEMVALEYARVFRLYNKLRIPERTAIEFFAGVHEINAVGTFRFLRQHFHRSSPQ